MKKKLPQLLSIKELESFIQTLPKDMIDKLRSDQMFRLTSVVWILVNKLKEDDPQLERMATESVIQAFDVFMSRGDLH